MKLYFGGVEYMYVSLMALKNFRCFDATPHIITFNPGLYRLQ